MRSKTALRHQLRENLKGSTMTYRKNYIKELNSENNCVLNCDVIAKRVIKSYYVIQYLNARIFCKQIIKKH
jgi:hypothetical protein